MILPRVSNILRHPLGVRSTKQLQYLHHEGETTQSNEVKRVSHLIASSLARPVVRVKVRVELKSGSVMVLVLAMLSDESHRAQRSCTTQKIVPLFTHPSTKSGVCRRIT